MEKVLQLHKNKYFKENIEKTLNFQDIKEILMVFILVDFKME